MNKHILADEVQVYLRSRLGESPSEVALAKSPFTHVSASELAEQLDGMQRSRFKLPLWYQTPGVYYPRKLSIEQSSSETTARYKAKLIGPDKRVVDITGGFGVDSFFLAQVAKHVTYIERNPQLTSIVSHNMGVLGARNTTCLCDDGIHHVLSAPDGTYDTVYTDPSRRVQSQKVIQLSDCVPDIVLSYTDLLDKSPTLLIKAAPMLDITGSLRKLAHVAEVHVLSVANECKELLFVLKRNHTGEPKIIAGILDSSETKVFSFFPSEENEATSELGSPKSYLYEPDAAIMKSGAYKLISLRFGLQKLHSNTHLYTSGELVHGFPGRSFRIDAVVSYSQFKKDKTRQSGNITARNFPLKADELRRKHRIGEHKDRFLFFCTDSNGQTIVIFASK